MLWKKLLRDLWGNKVSNFAIILIIGMGIMLYISLSLVMDTLDGSRTAFYAVGKFPDAYVELVSAPWSVVDRVRETEGVSKVEGRFITDVRIDENFGAPSSKTKYIRLLSETRGIGEYLLIEGHSPEEKSDQIVIAQDFANANRLKVGDRIPIIVSGRIEHLEICGIAQSPEYVYALRSVAQFFPDPTNFSIGFMHRESIRRITGTDHLTQILYHTKSGYSQQDVEKRLEILLKDYGVVRAYPMDDQTSNLMMTQELHQLKGASVVTPIILLSMSAMILFIMLGRVVDRQRGQIGLLKAFGLSDPEIFLHYLMYSMTISILGGVLGIVLGFVLSDLMVDVYAMFFNMPFVKADTSPSHILQALGMTAVFGTLSGIRASCKASGLSPSEAMRAKAPDIVRSSLPEKLRHLTDLFTTAGKMSLRNIFRNPARSVFVLIGVVITFAYAVVPWGFIRATDRILFSNYTEVERYNVKVYLTQLMDAEAVRAELIRRADVQRAEALLEIPVTLTKAHVRENVALIAIEDQSSLFTLKKDGRRIQPPPNAVILSQRLAEKLNVSKGNILQMESPLFKYKDEKVEVIVYEIIEQTVGMSAYANIRHIGGLIGDENAASSVLLRGTPDSSEALKRDYKDSAQIDDINDTDDMISMMREFVQTFVSMMWLLLIIAIGIGFAVIYNSYSIILSEREKEFASLLVMGMSEKEVIGIISLEQWLISIAAFPLGVPVIRTMVDIVGKASSNDTFTFDFEVEPAAYAVGLAITVMIILVGQLSASLKIKRIKVSDALKADE